MTRTHSKWLELTQNDLKWPKITESAKMNMWHRVTISCGRVGRGIQPPFIFQRPTLHTNIDKVSNMLIFSLFDSITTDQRMEKQTNRPMDGRTNGWFDKASYEVARPQLKAGSTFFTWSHFPVMMKSTTRSQFYFSAFSTNQSSKHRTWSAVPVALLEIILD